MKLICNADGGHQTSAFQFHLFVTLCQFYMASERDMMSQASHKHFFLHFPIRLPFSVMRQNENVEESRKRQHSKDAHTYTHGTISSSIQCMDIQLWPLVLFWLSVILDSVVVRGCRTERTFCCWWSSWCCVANHSSCCCLPACHTQHNISETSHTHVHRITNVGYPRLPCHNYLLLFFFLLADTHLLRFIAKTAQQLP